MCGLVGFSSAKGNKYSKRAIDVMIMWNALKRGTDSTGLYSPLNGLKKSEHAGDEFILFKEDHYLEDTMIMAHVRAATVGAKIVANSHPFQIDNYILQHNFKFYTNL